MRGRILAVAAAVALTVAGAVLGYNAHRSDRPVDLTPAGAYPVGRALLQWADRSRTDQFAPLGGTPRVLSVAVWYPATAGGGTPSAYMPGAWQGLHQFGWAQTDFGRIRTGTRDDAPLAAGPFPLIVLLPGLGLSAPQYTTIASGLAARGYVVAGVTPTYSANLTVLGGQAVKSTKAGDPSDLDGPRGDQLVAVWAADARFAAERAAVQFGSHVDQQKVVYAGHSFGGAAALEACRTDPRCAGAADLDGTPFGPVAEAGLTRPALLLSSSADGIATDAAAHRLVAASRQSAVFTVDGTEHFAFTDYAAYRLAAPLRRLLPIGRLDGRRALAITTDYLDAFLGAAARGETWQPPAYPEVHPDDMLSR